MSSTMRSILTTRMLYMAYDGIATQSPAMADARAWTSPGVKSTVCTSGRSARTFSTVCSTPRRLPRRPSNGVACVMVARAARRRSILAISARPVLSRICLRASPGSSRWTMAARMSLTTGPGESSQSAVASRILPFPRMLKTPVRKSS